ncbi:putative Glucose-repressible alcohol dehydrogenase transcriptional effector [Drepanopeziza brunnea f. sp. 'multigermtubi' MB_m1]|uniref:CCR4-Not complex 3'-5'-exoribonuclease subunit Ccr4 n=1 Tax=Marssonina brunnea f. sp. multigermtubi (strain MB_m1) TaxID=1072389 RepID=K1WTY3_MARBU|nr:putative Glucose-repressible alcohol dehydrogenase transcriptional effector [Drepanopeziza brunnea f. sp. 'multigermtubi' MB_m1]EKD21095.1 putative Glucose-repressible alcohol dehydrogenase transcriptional effector [Drepanopeziza brunnea f. sp. 'multigermtubi' MB_m1]
MADAYRFSQQSAGSYYFPQQTQQHLPRQQIIRNTTPPSSIRPVYNADTPSPSRSPDPHSPAPNIYAMFNQSHQQGQHGRVNGGPGRGNMPIMFNNFQHQNSPHHPHNAHNTHTTLQQDHNTHSTNGGIIGHHATYSSGVLSNATPSFTPNSLTNGHSGTTRGGQAVQISEHWARQLEMHKESEKAHVHMADGHSHHYARMKAGENKGLALVAPPDPDTQDSDEKDLSRMSTQSTKRQDWFNLDFSGQGIKVLAEPIFQYQFLKKLYVASNKLTRLPSSIRHLRSLQHLDASNNLLTELPPELGMCVFLENLLVFDNSIQTLPNELGSLFHLEMLGIEGNPLAPELKQEIMERGTKSLITLLQNQAPPPMPPNSRDKIELQEGEPNPNQETFKVYSFNILSDQACTRKMYGYSPAEALEWSYRKESILTDIQSNDADFVCLQEVDTDTYESFFRMQLAYNDYKGAFWARTRSKTMAEKEAVKVDGCATFWKNSKYILLDKQLIDFANIAINRPDMKSHHDIFNRVMPRDHIGVVTFFENRQTGSRLILVNTHIFWDPAYADVKLIQTAILIGEVNKLAEKYAKWPACKDKKAFGLANEDADQDTSPEPTPQPSREYTSKTQIPLVICADQNSTPDSSVFELLAKGSVRAKHPELGGRSYGNFSKDGIEHPFSLRSAYTNLDKTPDAVPFTNYVPTFKGVIDHIWYSTNALENISLLGQVDPEYMKAVPGFPNYHFPSDHLSLMAEFAVKGAKGKKVITEPDFGPSSRSNDRRRN